MAHNFAVRARRVAWNSNDDKDVLGITRVRRVGTDSTLNDEDETSSISTSIRRIQASERVECFVPTLRKDGCIIVDNFTTIPLLEKAQRGAKSWLRTRDEKVSTSTIPLIKQSPAIRNNFLANDLYQELCKEFLTVETTKWKEDQLRTETCQPILSSAAARILQVVKTDTGLYRHDRALAVRHEKHDEYEQGQDVMLGLMVPGLESIRVRVVLGSHLYGDESPDFGKEMVESEVKPGQALIVLGSLYHAITAHGEPQSDAEPAIVHALWSCTGVYQPEEQLASMLTLEEVLTYPETIQNMLR